MNTMKLRIGLFDDPETQAQDDYSLDLYRSNFAIFGSSMSGKTTLLKTILLRIHQVCRATEKEEIYILDFGSNLNEYKSLPYVVACFDAGQDENIRRIFRKVEDRLSENTKDLKGSSYLQCDPNNRPAHITFLIDGLNSFLTEDRYGIYHEMLQRFARDGLSKGLSVIFTAHESSGGVHKMIQSFKTKAALDMPKDAYSDIFGNRVEKPMPIKGRGMINSDNGIVEFQAYYPYSTTTSNDKDEVKRFIDNFLSCYSDDSHRQVIEKCEHKKMKSFTDDLTKDRWKDYTQAEYAAYRNSQLCTEVIVGLDYYTLAPIKIDLLKTRSIAIYGKKNSGKTNLLSLILEVATSISNVRVVVLEDGRKGVEDPKKSGIVANIIASVDHRFCYSLDDFSHYLEEEGYFKFSKTMMPFQGGMDEADEFEFTPKETPYTVFVIQSRLFYLTTHGVYQEQFIQKLDQFVSNESIGNKLFVFSDVQDITDRENMAVFNNWIDHAFLLDDIVRFITGQRGQRSVFSTQDIDELKASFGKCELGDGYYLNIEQVELNKIRFIKQEEIQNG